VVLKKKKMNLSNNRIRLSKDNIIQIALGLLSIIASFIAINYSHSLESKGNELEEVKTKFNESVQYFLVDKGVKNKEFYNEFNKQILNAKSIIFVTGKGFDFDKRDSVTAKNYIDTIRKALDSTQELEIHRIQFGQGASEKWLEELKKLKKDYDKRFICYITDTLNNDMVHVCAIDPADKENCIAEIMMPSFDGYYEKESAGCAIFIKGKAKIANAIKERFVNIVETSACKELKIESDFDSVINKHHTTKAIFHSGVVSR